MQARRRLIVVINCKDHPHEVAEILLKKYHSSNKGDTYIEVEKKEDAFDKFTQDFLKNWNLPDSNEKKYLLPEKFRKRSEEISRNKETNSYLILSECNEYKTGNSKNHRNYR